MVLELHSREITEVLAGTTITLVVAVAGRPPRVETEPELQEEMVELEFFQAYLDLRLLMVAEVVVELAEALAELVELAVAVALLILLETEVLVHQIQVEAVLVEVIMAHIL